MEQEENNLNKSSNFVNIITFIIAIALIAYLAYFGYNKFIKINDVKQNNGDLQSSDVYSLGKEKYTFISSKRDEYDNSLIFYKDVNLNINNIGNKDILNVAYSNLSKEDKNVNGSASYDCFLNNGTYTLDNYPDSCQSESFDKSVLEEQVINIFSRNINVEYTNFNPTGSMSCYFDNSYKCYLNQNEVNTEKFLTLTSYAYAEYLNDRLFVYSYLLAVKIYGSDAGIYSDIKATDKIDSYENYLSLTNGVITDETTSKLVDKYKDKISKYKAIFINENGKYVFYSNEKVSN